MLPCDIVSHVSVALIGGKNGTNLGIEDICLDSDKIDMSNSQV